MSVQIRPFAEADRPACQAIAASAALTSYGAHMPPAFGTFAGSLVVGAASNLFARVMQRPGALVRETGIILLVPGSVGFRSLSYVLDRDVLLGIDTAVTMTTLLTAIVAGLLFGDFLITPRRKL